VGFGSTPAQKPRSKTTSDVSTMLSKSWGNFTQMAGTAAQQATAAMRSGTETISQAIKDREMTEKVHTNARVFADKGKEWSMQGWSGLRSFYASVASKVETAAKENGYSINLGASKIQESNKASLTTASYSQLSQSESSGLDAMISKQREVDDSGSFQGFSNEEPGSPVMDFGRRRSDKKGEKSAPVGSSVGRKSDATPQEKKKDWSNLDDSADESSEDEDWGKW